MPVRPTIKRLLRRRSRAALIIVLLPTMYFAQYFTLFWLAGEGIVSTRPLNFARDTIYYPIEWAANTPLPVSPDIHATADWCYTRGNAKDVPWRDWYAYWEGVRTGKPTSRPAPRP